MDLNHFLHAIGGLGYILPCYWWVWAIISLLLGDLGYHLLAIGCPGLPHPGYWFWWASATTSLILGDLGYHLLAIGGSVLLPPGYWWTWAATFWLLEGCRIYENKNTDQDFSGCCVGGGEGGGGDRVRGRGWESCFWQEAGVTVVSLYGARKGRKRARSRSQVHHSQ